MDKRVFDDAIGEVPPTAIDVEAVITRGRRADRIRRVANPAVAAGVAVVLAVGAIAFTMTRGGDESGGVGAASPPSPTSTTAPTSSTTGPPTSTEKLGTLEPPEACSRTDLETGAQVVARLTPVLKAAVQAQRPDVRLTTNSGNEYPDGVSHGPLDFFYVTGDTPTDEPFCDQDNYFLTRATTEGPEGKGNILAAVQVSSRDTLDECLPPTSGGEEVDCQPATGPNGELIVKKTLHLEGGTSMTRVEVLKPDGTSVIVQSEDIDTSVKTGDAPTSSAPPLNYDQLVAIATDPGMTLFP